MMFGKLFEKPLAHRDRGGQHKVLNLLRLLHIQDNQMKCPTMFGICSQVPIGKVPEEELDPGGDLKPNEPSLLKTRQPKRQESPEKRRAASGPGLRSSGVACPSGASMHWEALGLS